MSKKSYNQSRQTIHRTESFYEAPILNTTLSRCYNENKFNKSTSYLSQNRTQNNSKVNRKVSHRNHNRKLCTEKQWYEHCKTLQRLSTPKTEKVDTLCVWPRGKKVALSKLCPRINYLSQPKNPIKKRAYVRDPDEIVLPGKIKDWQEHCLWLHKNAQPKKYQNLDYVQSQKKKKKLTRLKRTLWLCQPKNSEIIKETCDRCNSFTKPITPVTEKALHYFPSNRIMDLSEPKPFVMGRVYMEHVSSDCLMVVSKHAQKCKASRRIKSLSIPKGWIQCHGASELYNLGGGELCQADSHLHKLSASQICQMIRPKDYRHVKYLDVYRISKQFPANDTTHHKSQQPYHHANKC